MEFIRVAKVEDVSILRRGVPLPGTLHLTQHHIIFRHDPSTETPPNDGSQPGSQKPKTPEREIWITYPIISQAIRVPLSVNGYAALRLRNRDFSFVTFHFKSDRDCKDVFLSVKALSCKVGIERLYAFFYTPPAPERPFNGWTLYDATKEFERMGVGSRSRSWRISKINQSYTFCQSYPSLLVVPASISDNVLNYAAKYRSRERIPALTYLHPLNNCSITRSSQPLTGVRGNRSVQDEKLVAAIFSSTGANAYSRFSYALPCSEDRETGSNQDNFSLEESYIDTSERIYGAQQQNLIVDARPTVNAYAMQAVGMGSENMDNYRMGGTVSKQYLGIDNIHVMRDSLQKVVEAIKDSDITALPPNKELLVKSGWLKHIANILEGTLTIVRQVAVLHSHVLIHCSDGWDRTSQLSALAQICLDPYYRTLEGFMILVEKDWLSFGHKFRDRSGIGGSEKWFIEKGGPVYEPQAAGDLDEKGPGSVFQGGMEQAFAQAKTFFGASKSNLADLEEDGEFVYPRKGTPPPATQTVNPKETSPTFHQFLDATYQLMLQNPTRFEFNERFLRRLLYHLYSCQYGTFLYNNERERVEAKAAQRTRSVWDYFLSRKSWFMNASYDKSADDRDKGSWRVIEPKASDMRWWFQLWGRSDREMNGNVDDVATSSAGGKMDKSFQEATIVSEVGTSSTPGAAASMEKVINGLEGLRVNVTNTLSAIGTQSEGQSKKSGAREMEMM